MPGELARNDATKAAVAACHNGSAAALVGDVFGGPVAGHRSAQGSEYLPVDPRHVSVAVPHWGLDLTQAPDLFRGEGHSGRGGVLVHTRHILSTLHRPDP